MVIGECGGGCSAQGVSVRVRWRGASMVLRAALRRRVGWCGGGEGASLVVRGQGCGHGVREW